MIGGVKFCGGCNPRYERGKALETIKNHFKGRVEFVNVQEDAEYDFVLVIGGCTNCCASYQQYKAKEYILMWNFDHIEETIKKIEEMGGMRLELEGNL
ncbi:hypothetical protein [Sinanaerobacter chloroacetimidivorans]|jgi:Fe-S cluster biogenesis protein NfuA|uniref:hypothetical protein n=1 Tax=Sinanaerobacter chloroacetimidivorans TaxID=2818044 RepID=UPI001D05544F|nr:hypothetical protein [Sinanaerobacter chloroacetimidivorans]